MNTSFVLNIVEYELFMTSIHLSTPTEYRYKLDTYTIGIPTNNCEKKLAVSDISFCKHAVIEFLMKENSAADIYSRLIQVYGEAVSEGG